MKATKLGNLETSELVTQNREAREQLFRLRFQMGMGQYEGLKKYRALKKDRARMLTVLAERQRNAANEAAVKKIEAAAAKSAAPAKAPAAGKAAAAGKASAAVAAKKAPAKTAAAARKTEKTAK